MLSLLVSGNKWDKVYNALSTGLSNLENTCDKLAIDVIFLNPHPYF